jgi:hypothetical protein
MTFNDQKLSLKYKSSDRESKGYAFNESFLMLNEIAFKYVSEGEVCSLL